MSIRLHGIYWVVIAAAFGLGVVVDRQFSPLEDHGQFAIREYDTRYSLIRPLLICQVHENEETEKLRGLEQKANSIVESAKQKDKIFSASVYYRDLNSGRWIGVNELEEFEPASLLKVPLMMAYLKEAEDDPSVLNKVYSYINTYEPDPLVAKPLLVSNQHYSVLDLIHGMVVQSDNQAMTILKDNATSELLKETYDALDLSNPYEVSKEPYQLSAKKYSLFFRVLYNSTFLNREMSNKALELLSQSEFKYGIRAGTPVAIPVAHKHGVRGVTLDDGSHEVEVSDCGIVYNPASPYLLCIMAKGADAYAVSGVIKELAEAVYQSVVLSVK